MSRVSCIMPTANRRRFVPCAIELFLAQDYNDKELVIIDDGTDAVSDLVPSHPQIRYFRESPGTRSLGEKRNLACELSRGEIILHWDDDDWHAPWRISYQVERLNAENLDLCGLDRPLFVDAAAAQAWEYTLMSVAAGWLCGATLGYRKSFWHDHHFSDVRIGEDTRFVRSARGISMGALADNRFFLARIHAANTASKRPRGRWPPRPIELIRSMVGSDWDRHFGDQDGLPLLAPQRTVGTALVAGFSSVTDIIRITPLIRAAYYLGYDVDVRISSGDSLAHELLRDACEIRRLSSDIDDQRKHPTQPGRETETNAYDIAVLAAGSLPLPSDIRARQQHVLSSDPRGSGGTSAVEALLRSLGWQGRAPSPFVSKSTRRYGLAFETVAIHADRRFRATEAGRNFLQELSGLFRQVALVGAMAGSADGGAFHWGVDWPSHVHDFVGKLDLRDTASLLSQCAGLITSNGDLMSLGVALCIPTFGILLNQSLDREQIQSPFFEPISRPACPEATPVCTDGRLGFLGMPRASEIGAFVTATLRARSVVRQLPAARSRRNAQGQGPASRDTSASGTSRPRPSEADETHSVRDRLHTRPITFGLPQKALWRKDIGLPIPSEWYDQDYFDGELRNTWPRGYTWPWCGQVFTETAAMLHMIFPGATSYLDAGCGKGFLVRALFERGLEVQGFDYSAWAIANAEPAVRHLVRLASAETVVYGDRSTDVLVAMSLLENLTEDQIRLFLVRAKGWVRQALFATIQTGSRTPGFDPFRATIRDDQWWYDRFAESGWRRSELQEVVQGQHLMWRMRWTTYVFEPIH